MTLIIGLLLVAVLSIIWIRHTNMEHRLSVTKYLVQEIADRFVEEQEGKAVPRAGIIDYIEQRKNLLDTEIDPIIYIVNAKGKVIANPFDRNPYSEEYFPLQLLKPENSIQRLQLENGAQSYIVKTPILYEDITVGWVVAIQPARKLTEMNEEYRLLAIMLVSLALIGWATIYFLSRRLSRPIQDVARAATHIKEENYNFTLPEEIREQEVHELVHSFKDMAGRLQQLEGLRSEMLAGVTHELKTPITSITGLIQAVRDNVVEGEEADEFLHVSLQEANRLKAMVSDLLAFNSFVAHAVPVTLETHEINSLVKEVLHQWQVANETDEMKVTVAYLEIPRNVQVDAIRFQQIIVNLLNNAKQAIQGDGRVHLSVKGGGPEEVNIDIIDDGPGVKDEDKELIFERFFRGNNKKYDTHGIGLGLPFSKMMARSMKGELRLKESNPGRTVFSLQLPIISNDHEG
nr:HAMP domain-containing sensor histidine kinase [Bacillus piscicola]